MSSATSIPELLIQFFEHLSLRDLISTSHVDRQWRALVPHIESPIRSRLLSLAFTAVESAYPISQSVRIAYVGKIEITYSVLIPEPYRTILTEWSASQPLPGMHWPHSVRFHASGFCFCHRDRQEYPDVCSCTDQEVRGVAIMIPDPTFQIVMEEARVPVEEVDTGYELFFNPVRLHTDEQNAQTLRFIRAHPAEGFQWTGIGRRSRQRPGWERGWAKHNSKALTLSRYHFHKKTGTLDGATRVCISQGDFMMMLEGPTRRQIHAWASPGWYDGFEAENFWEWNYSEWDRDPSYSDSESEDDEDVGADPPPSTGE
ncbi:hypothetical protein DFH07DRAFT_260879 [Mycena maculata]|uniref:F-box domain-containing protein n=1 Tax=Mycena maculata TaxID=230809 RepID=A0AAD7MNI9_9AGAR|nr:hypothetical protein DFH07DRAFT_260879 [Mycena maculata]